MKHIYYKNDFAVEITLLNASGEVVAPPDWQWHIEFTDGRRKYICSVDKGNAKVVGNTIMCYIDNHKFCCGEVRYKFVQAIPDLNYLDGFQNLITPKALPIELWEQESDNDVNIQSSVVPAYVVYDAYMTAKANGYTGTADEYYNALNHIVDINKKESERVEAEANRATAEQQRVENFAAMESALTTATTKANTATTNATQATKQATTATKRANDISADLEAKREADYWRGAKGEKGDKGDTGAKGDRGEKGDQGERGLQGVQGVKGDDGVSPTVKTSKTGKVTTIEITDAQGTHTATVNDGESVEVVQSTGNSTTSVMSQKAVSDALSTKAYKTELDSYATKEYVQTNAPQETKESIEEKLGAWFEDDGGEAYGEVYTKAESDARYLRGGVEYCGLMEWDGKNEAKIYEMKFDSPKREVFIYGLCTWDNTNQGQFKIIITNEKYPSVNDGVSYFNSSSMAEECFHIHNVCGNYVCDINSSNNHLVPSALKRCYMRNLLTDQNHEDVGLITNLKIEITTDLVRIDGVQKWYVFAKN